MPGDFFQKGCPIAGGFSAAHAGDLQELGHGPGRFLSHVAKRGVGKDDIGRDILVPGEPEPEGFQCREQFAVGGFGYRPVRRGPDLLAGRLRGGPHRHGQLLAPEEHCPGGLGGLQGGVKRVDPEIALLHQIVDPQPRLRLLDLPHQAVGGQTLQAQLLHPFGLAAPQNLENQGFAHVVPQLFPDADHTGEDHLGLGGDVHLDKRIPAVAAVAAGIPVGLAEIVEDIVPQTAGGPAIAGHGLQPRQVLLMHLGQHRLGEIGVAAGLQKDLRGGDIAAGEEEDTVRRFAVPACPSRLLVVGLQALGHVIMYHKADVGFVDAHAEGIGGHHDGAAVELKVVLIGLAFRLGESGVVPGRGDPGVAEELADPFHLGPGGAVDDAGLAPPVLQEGQQGFVPALRRLDVEEEIGPVKAGDGVEGILQRQQPDDILLHLGRGRGGKGGDGRTAGQGSEKIRNLQIAGPEVLPPLGDAMGFVHGHQGNGKGPAQLLKFPRAKPLRRDIQELIRACRSQRIDPADLVRGQRAVEIGGADARLFQRGNLVLHQRDQRRDD